MSFGPRQAAVAGRFYPGEAAVLDREVARLLGPRQKDRRLLGVVAPHAGYVYSGGVAGQVFAAAHVPDVVVVMGPNHTGLGARVSLRAGGEWLLPGARVPVAEEVCRELLKVPGIEADERAHLREHSVEVEVPFLRAKNPALRLVPFVLGPLEYGECRALGRALAERLPDDVLLVASSDMNHYLPDDLTRVRDRMAIERMLALDARGLHELVEDQDLSMCGYVPATVMLEYANARGATSAELVGYATSGDAFGDRDRVVGYAGIAVA